MREDFRALLELEDDIVVVGTATDGAEVVDLCARVDVDVVVMDVRMPRMDGIDATGALRERCPRTRVLVVTTFDLDEYVFGALRAGASGFLVKTEAPDALAAAVRTVARGDGIVSPRATSRLIEAFAAVGTSPPVPSADSLSAREIEVVRHVAAGADNRTIATALWISRATVKTHISNILKKLGLTSRLQIVIWAHERGISARSAGSPRHGRDDLPAAPT